jgi:hypothetical protein
MSEELMEGYEALQKAGSYRLVDFEWTEVVTLRSFPDLLLNRIVQEPPGPVAQVVTVVEARNREETDFECDTVTILPDGVSVSVQDVH